MGESLAGKVIKDLKAAFKALRDYADPSHLLSKLTSKVIKDEPVNAGSNSLGLTPKKADFLGLLYSICTDYGHSFRQRETLERAVWKQLLVAEHDPELKAEVDQALFRIAQRSKWACCENDEEAEKKVRATPLVFLSVPWVPASGKNANLANWDEQQAPGFSESWDTDRRFGGFRTKEEGGILPDFGIYPGCSRHLEAHTTVDRPPHEKADLQLGVEPSRC